MHTSDYPERKREKGRKDQAKKKESREEREGGRTVNYPLVFVLVCSKSFSKILFSIQKGGSSGSKSKRERKVSRWVGQMHEDRAKGKGKRGQGKREEEDYISGWLRNR